MSLRIHSIALDGFRKFREPFSVEGLTDGLNIIIEANETGKSTLLDALRAAFFVRHGTKNQLAQTYAPHNEAIGPKVQITFEAAGAPWSVTKRFLKGASVEVTGPQGRAQGDEAEGRLHTLLGSVRDTSQKGDPSTYGALGLLWVAQSEALEVAAPGPIVRDTIRSTLEAEVGSIMGGPAYKRVRGRIEDLYGSYWTPTGQKRDHQVHAQRRFETAETAARDAADKLAALEKTFSDLDDTRARLKLVEREIADDTDAKARQELMASLEIAKAATQILATRRAEQDAATSKAKSLEDLHQRHEQAIRTRDGAQDAVAQAREARATSNGVLIEAKQRVSTGRSALEQARMDRQQARAALTAGEEHQQAVRRRIAVAAARERHDALLRLERQHQDAKNIAATAISSELMATLEANERAVAEARAILNAGATHIVLSGSEPGLLIDGEPMGPGQRTLTRSTSIRFGNAELIITPAAAAMSAEERLTEAEQKRRHALDELSLADLAAARTRSDAARDATAELRTLQAQIQAETPAVDVIELAAGAEALKLFVTQLVEDEPDEAGSPPDMAALKKAVETMESTVAHAEGVLDSAIVVLRDLEEEDAPLLKAEAGALSDLTNVDALIASIEEHPDFADLASKLIRTRQSAAEAAVQFEEAKRNAEAHDQTVITRRIATIEARAKTAEEKRNAFEKDIGRLEVTVESEGGKGLADRHAAARDEVEAARAALQRITDEASTLKLLRETLDAARDETSAKFVGPVARRAKRHIERLLPGCDPSFSEDLALDRVTRGGLSESCSVLSKGTQEQLAVLTRIAFADLLLEQGRPVSLILDDPMVYSDDARLDLMIDILVETAERMQVILLTCRDRAFRHVVGNRVSLVSAAQTPRATDSA